MSNYAVIGQTPAVVPDTFNDLGAAYDYMVSQHRVTGDVVELRDRRDGRLLRARGRVATLPAIKLSEAMTRALSTTTKDGYVTGAANTLKALANKGLLQVSGGKYQVTSLGRQYQRQG